MELFPFCCAASHLTWTLELHPGLRRVVLLGTHVHTVPLLLCLVLPTPQAAEDLESLASALLLGLGFRWFLCLFTFQFCGHLFLLVYVSFVFFYCYFIGIWGTKRKSYTCCHLTHMSKPLFPKHCSVLLCLHCYCESLMVPWLLSCP